MNKEKKPASNLFIILIFGLGVYNIFYGVFCYLVGGLAGAIFGGIIMLVVGIIETYHLNKQRNAEK